MDMLLPGGILVSVQDIALCNPTAYERCRCWRRAMPASDPLSHRNHPQMYFSCQCRLHITSLSKTETPAAWRQDQMRCGVVHATGVSNSKGYSCPSGLQGRLARPSQPTNFPTLFCSIPLSRRENQIRKARSSATSMTAREQSGKVGRDRRPDPVDDAGGSRAEKEGRPASRIAEYARLGPKPAGLGPPRTRASD